MSTGSTQAPTTDDAVPEVALPDQPARPRGVSTWGWSRTVVFILVTSVLSATVVVGAVVGVFGVVSAVLDRGTPVLTADGTVVGVVTYDGLTAQHADTPVDYEQLPPVGGDHLSVWQDCGFYDAPIITEAGVHSLEHGAVWVTYDPDLPPGQVETLEQLAAVNPYLLVSPMTGLPSAVVASAWGVQLKLDSVDDARLPAFLVAYLQGPQNPEPGAPCSGGLSGTASQMSQV